MSKAMVDAKQTDTHALWSDDWAKGFYETGNVFCYFGPAWLIDFSMHCDEKAALVMTEDGLLQKDHRASSGAVLGSAQQQVQITRNSLKTLCFASQQMKRQ